ncbi:hypothetical protein FM036_35720 [Nostoc sp. HG1]|nr:hypothetical protein [Nostoc sp. HG1]
MKRIRTVALGGFDRYHGLASCVGNSKEAMNHSTLQRDGVSNASAYPLTKEQKQMIEVDTRRLTRLVPSPDEESEKFCGCPYPAVTAIGVSKSTIHYVIRLRFAALDSLSIPTA